MWLSTTSTSYNGSSSINYLTAALYNAGYSTSETAAFATGVTYDWGDDGVCPIVGIYGTSSTTGTTHIGNLGLLAIQYLYDHDGSTMTFASGGALAN